MNVAIFIGNIGNDIELKKTSSGTSVATFSLAVKRAYSKENQQNTDWFRVTVYGTQADNLVTYCSKGSKVAVNGRIEIDEVEKSGTKSYYTKVIANSVKYLDIKGSNQAVQQQTAQSQANTAQSQNGASNDFFNDFSNNNSNDILSGLDISDDFLPF